MLITYGDPMPSCFRSLTSDLVRLRGATPSDVAQMRKLEQESSTAAHWSESQYGGLFDSPPAARIIRIAEDDSDTGRIQGFLIARCLSDEWEIENIVVDPLFRRIGVATSLIRDLLSAAHSSGATKVLLEVRESNEAARRLYEKIGFTLQGRRKDYYRNPPEDAILYRLSLQFYDKIP